MHICIWVTSDLQLWLSQLPWSPATYIFCFVLIKSPQAAEIRYCVFNYVEFLTSFIKTLFYP